MTDLTGEERTALAIAAQGYTLAAGAKRLGVSTRTINRLLSDAQAKLGARSRIHAVGIAATLGIIAVYPPGGPR